MLIFETKRLVVRRYTENDKDHFFSLNGNEEVVRYIRAVKTKEECDEFLLQAIAYSETEKLFGRWAVEDKLSKEFVGSFAMIPVEGKDQMQLGYSLLPEHWGKGYATELTIAGLHYVFTKTQINPIYAYAEEPNTSSQKVLLKAGFKPNGSHMEGDKAVEGFVLEKEEYLRRNYLQD
jgi:ribosomal-protein-alanine N-acetyltransferase